MHFHQMVLIYGTVWPYFWNAPQKWERLPYSLLKPFSHPQYDVLIFSDISEQNTAFLAVSTLRRTEWRRWGSYVSLVFRISQKIFLRLLERIWDDFEAVEEKLEEDLRKSVRFRKFRSRYSKRCRYWKYFRLIRKLTSQVNLDVSGISRIRLHLPGALLRK